jgi:hypothetical protein
MSSITVLFWKWDSKVIRKRWHTWCEGLGSTLPRYAVNKWQSKHNRVIQNMYKPCYTTCLHHQTCLTYTTKGQSTKLRLCALYISFTKIYLFCITLLCLLCHLFIAYLGKVLPGPSHHVCHLFLWPWSPISK